MSADELAPKARREPPWDDLREQRVLGRVLAARRAPPSRRGRAIAVVAACAVAVAAAIVLLVVRTRAPELAAPVASASAPSFAAGDQTIALADGSKAVLVTDASVAVEEQSKSRVQIAQTRGLVRYEVRPDPSREFSVHAAGTTVRVRGTVFAVDVTPDAVEVRVERGRVEVDDGTRTRDLVAGESLDVPARPSPAPACDNDAAADEPDVAPSASAAPPPPTAAELLAKADAARVAGRLDEAAVALEALLARYPRDGRVSAALFSLGRVERARGRQASAARAFERCARGGGPLAEDAWAEAVASWTAAGSPAAARADAAQYLARFPNGPQAPRMRALTTAP